MIIKIKNLTKKYKTKIVLDNINLTLLQGKTYGLLGKNGAGKSTLLNILTGFVQKDTGSIILDEVDMDNKKQVLDLKKNIGFLSEKNSLIEEFSGKEYLDFVGKLYKIPINELNYRINGLSKYFFDDINDMNMVISKYSTGMKKKLEFCASVLHKPCFLILDEPFSGLDFIAARKLVNFLKKYQNDNRIILIAGQNLDYIDKIVTDIILLEKGKIIFEGSFEKFTF